MLWAKFCLRLTWSDSGIWRSTIDKLRKVSLFVSFMPKLPSKHFWLAVKSFFFQYTCPSASHASTFVGINLIAFERCSSACLEYSGMKSRTLPRKYKRVAFCFFSISKCGAKILTLSFNRLSVEQGDCFVNFSLDHLLAVFGKVSAVSKTELFYDFLHLWFD